MSSEQINKIIKSKEADYLFENPASIFNEFFNGEMKEEKDFAQKTVGIGLRKHDELAEDMSLIALLELALKNNDEKSFELLFNFCCKHGN